MDTCKSTIYCSQSETCAKPAHRCMRRCCIRATQDQLEGDAVACRYSWWLTLLHRHHPSGSIKSNTRAKSLTMGYWLVHLHSENRSSDRSIPTGTIPDIRYASLSSTHCRSNLCKRRAFTTILSTSNAKESLTLSSPASALATTISVCIIQDAT
jgi:hypothetical protein